MATLSVYWRVRDGCGKRPMLACMTKWESQTEATFEPATRFRLDLGLSEIETIHGFLSSKSPLSERYSLHFEAYFWTFLDMSGTVGPIVFKFGMWTEDRDLLAAYSQHVIGGMSSARAHVYTPWPYLRNGSVDFIQICSVGRVGTNKTKALHRILVGCLSTCARTNPFFYI